MSVSSLGRSGRVSCPSGEYRAASRRGQRRGRLPPRGPGIGRGPGAAVLALAARALDAGAPSARMIVRRGRARSTPPPREETRHEVRTALRQPARCAEPDAAARIGRAAEAAGFESLWVADHVVLPDPPMPGRPMPPDMRLLDPIVSLTFLAAHTTRILLATGVIILPQRQALVLAKQLASLDVLSKGGVVFGLGVGWCEPEMRSVGRAVRRARPRGRRLPGGDARGVDAAQAVAQGPVRRVRGRAGDAAPGPDSRRRPSSSAAGRAPAYRRAVTQGHGWYGFGMDVASTQKVVADLARDAGQGDAAGRARRARDQHHAAGLRRARRRDREGVRRRRRGSPDPAAAARTWTARRSSASPRTPGARSACGRERARRRAHRQPAMKITRVETHRAQPADA